MIEKYRDFLEALKGKYVSPYWRNFSEQCTEEIKTVIEDIAKNGVTYQLDKWFKIYEKYTEIEPVIIALCKQECCPNVIINQIIKKLEIKHSEPHILHSLLSRNNLTDTQISDIIAFKKYEIGRFFPKYHSSFSNREWKMPFCEDTTNQIVKKMYEQDGTKMDTAYLLYTNDKNFINEILEEHKDYEPFRDALVNNFYLSDSERNEIFDLGCNRKEVERPTGYMISTMYRECVEAYFENDYNTVDNLTEKRILTNAYYEGFTFIQQMLRKGFFNDAMQMDLMYRLSKLRIRSQNPIVAELLRIAKVEAVFQIAETGIVSKDKEYMYNNKNCPTDILYRKTYELIKKIDKALKNSTSISDNWCTQLSNILGRISLTSDYESVLLKIPGKKLHKSLACSPLTSIETLEKIEVEISEPKNQMLASVNIALQKANIDTEITSKCLYFLAYRIEPAHLTSDFDLTFAATRQFKDMIYSPKCNAIKIMNTLKDLPLKTPHEFPKNILERFVNNIEYMIETDKLYDNSTIENTSTPELKLKQYHLISNIQKYKNSYDVLMNIDEYGGEYNKIVETLNSRDEKDIIYDQIVEKIRDKKEREKEIER